MTKLYFIRHGKTEWNNEGRFQGAQGDSPLLPESYEQIEKLGNYLQDIEFKHAFISPLRRARLTAEGTLSLLKNRPSMTLNSGLIEFKLGAWEGQTFAAVKKNQAEQYEAWRNHPDQYDATQVPGAETFEAVQKRFKYAVDEAVRAYGGEDVNLIFFAHGMLLTIGIETLLEKPLAQLRARGGLSNTSTSILETNDGQTYHEISRNDTSYLGVIDDPSNTI
ncbi:histidine phosphatase family protein [Weissella koreensis]|uniref:Histidine phosphatase family protein n=1 Tax=Weissella koreensis TaxID=165096 RepID=A0A7H1MN49_9LACO|nr:histidine phosphatase family protein [Weissella koreensis]AEJ24067.1 fructose-2,6-bisphosphatase [Weissella koreensis KACC 15510]AVH75681.1 histidine phosphatase family protein [Weissella koreensis]EJF34668.1 phosphoglycerate mutase [Weissella koreensis KCTC 3621]MCZ9311395.1 histidine phosphatase family protein [Weissella koreensis]QGN20904.1 histidine phosphatase family protein [Weissella koreensis]